MMHNSMKSIIRICVSTYMLIFIHFFSSTLLFSSACPSAGGDAGERRRDWGSSQGEGRPQLRRPDLRPHRDARRRARGIRGFRARAALQPGRREPRGQAG